MAKTVKWCFIVFCVFLASLFFRQQELPEFLVRGLCERFSAGDTVLSCDSASFGFREGLKLRDVRLYDRSRHDAMSPVCSVESVSIWPLRRRVRIVAAKFPRLGDEYYEGDVSPAAETGFDGSAIKLPRLPAFELELIDPEILGVAPERVTARVEVSSSKLELRSFHLDWPDQDIRMWLDGFCTVDLAGARLFGDVRGTARQEHIRPLLKALDLPSSYPYMGGYSDTGTNGFTAVVGAVPAYCGWEVNLRTAELDLKLDLHPQACRYNDVPLAKVDGGLGVHVYYTGEYMGYDIKVGPLVASDHKGRQLAGWLVVHGTNDLDYLEFDASSELEKQDTLDIMGYLNEGTMDFLNCLTPPKVTAKGIFNCDEVNIPNNDFGGHFEVAKAGFLNQELSDAAFDYHLQGSEMTFDNVRAKGVSGGDISGKARFHLPIADGDEELSGDGSVVIKNGKLVRIPVFLALTSALADNVPGIEKLVNQSEARCDFTISNGVFKTENLIVQGAVFCIKISGTCDLTTDEVDLIARCTVMKEESVLGKYLIRPVLWPFTKLLTEFHVTGTKDAPKLTNTSVKKISETFKKVFD